MATEKKKLGECTVGCKRDVLHLVVLIAGTTDPINSFNTLDKRAVSYKAPNQYWDDDPDNQETSFYPAIKKLVKSNPQTLELFDFHGWSGDNRKGNREVAGAYLVNRLVGANGEKAFYGPSHQKKTIHIHLIGHSHGGNVINEMTQQMAKLGATWPTTWKVKSFTYLSTPFFQKIHQVNVGSFVHPQAEILNVYNDYDLTQRMLADFSMYTLHDVIKVNGLTETISSNITQLMTAFNAVPWDLATDLWLNENEGRRLYTAARDFLGDFESDDKTRKGVVRFLQKIQEIAGGLNQPVQYKVDAGLSTNNTITQSYKLLSDTNLANLKRVIAALTKSVNRSVLALNEAIGNNSYSRAGFAAALYDGALPLANSLADFLNLPAGVPNVAASGVIWQTLVGVVADAIEVFDDTVTKPDAQFKGSRSITSVSVTTRDAYNASTQKANYLKLIAKIEALEKRYSASPSQNLLLDLLLTLMVHNPQGRQLATMFSTWAGYIDKVEYGASGDLDKTLKAVRTTFTNVANALNSRFEGSLEDPTDTAPDPKHGGQRGSLPYLLIESHSTSRRVLHPEVKTFLQRMMG